MTATDVRPGPDAPCRVLIAPCGCLVGGDITMSGPGFCRTRAEADEDAARGYREEVRTVAEFRAARLCGDATWHTPGDAPRATSDGMTATDVRPVPPARDAVTLGYDEASRVPEGEHVAREVFTAYGIPFVRCSCSTAKSPTSHRWLSEHVPNGGVAELQAVVKRQAEGAKA